MRMMVCHVEMGQQLKRAPPTSDFKKKRQEGMRVQAKRTTGAEETQRQDRGQGKAKQESSSPC